LKFVEKNIDKIKLYGYTKKAKYVPIKVPVGVYRACFGCRFTIWGIWIKNIDGENLLKEL
jgi:hypothetical protein